MSLKRMYALAVATLVVVGALALPSEASASPPDLLGYGPRTIAMGTTGVSYASGYEATWANPAGIARAERVTLTLGLALTSFEVELDNEDFYLDPALGVLIGFDLPIPLGGKVEDMFVLSAGFYTPTSGVLRIDAPYTDEPQFPLLNRSQSVSIMAGLGIDLSHYVPGLRLGIGVVGLARLIGSLRVVITETNEFLTANETQVLTNFAPTAGATYDRGRFRYGLSYRAEQQAALDIDLLVEGFPINVPPISINTIAQYQPHTLSAEASYDFDFGLLAALNLTWRHWSAWPGTVQATTGGSPAPPAPEFSDTLSLRLGLEQRFTKNRSDLFVRFGYAYEPTPAPPADLRPVLDEDGDPVEDDMGNEVYSPLRYLDNDRHLLSTGIGVVWRTPSGAVVLMDIYGQAQVLRERVHNIPQEGSTENMVTNGWIGSFGWTGGFGW